MNIPVQPLPLSAFTRRISSAIVAVPGLNDVWITAETSDLRSSGGHCYMELVEKDAAGAQLARVRAVMWAGTYARLGARFAAATGSRLASDMKVMVRVSVNFHSVYGLSLVINDIDPDFTAGDLARRRHLILRRLKQEGVLDLNRTLPWAPVPRRIAIVSARGAAGYGDFIKHLYTNPAHLRFTTELFEAVLQGERTAPSVIAALDSIAARAAEFDAVVIIRGGGAVSDLASFDDYNLAANVAQFPLPVIVGIGHERDITVLDYVAAQRVKTPTAAAELLIGRVGEALERLRVLARGILDTVTRSMTAHKQQLAYISGNLPALAANVLARARRRCDASVAAQLAAAVRNRLAAADRTLALTAQLIDMLAPEATLRRGYSITRVAGHAVTHASALAPGQVITTTFAKGSALSSIVTIADNGN